jgi:hypothetical protein
MQGTMQSASVGTTTRWIGQIMSALPVLFLILDAGIKVLQLAPAVEATTQLGYPASAVLGIGLLELVCLAIYIVPRTAVFGAILLTGYLGGALATQVRAGADLFPLVFPVMIGLLLWGGLYVRDDRLRALLPWRR